MSSETITHVVVPGTFDPVTLGHVDVIRRARRLFPRVTVAVAASVNTNGRGTAFTLEERADMIREAIALEGMPADIEVMPFTGLLVDFCKELGAGGVCLGERGLGESRLHLDGTLGQQPPGVGEPDPTAGGLDEGQPEVALGGAQLLGDRRPGAVGGGGDGGDAAPVRELAQQGEMTLVHAVILRS